jgi:hypothetical protein
VKVRIIIALLLALLLVTLTAAVAFAQSTEAVLDQSMRGRPSRRVPSLTRAGRGPRGAAGARLPPGRPAGPAGRRSQTDSAVMYGRESPPTDR